MCQALAFVIAKPIACVYNLCDEFVSCSRLEEVRTHLVLPDELVQRIDLMVGRRKRSRFVEEAVREKLRRETLLAALKETAGAFSTEESPQWATSESAAAWVRESRRRDDQRLRRPRSD
jgi:hypothetical protein